MLLFESASGLAMSSTQYGIPISGTVWDIQSMPLLRGDNTPSRSSSGGVGNPWGWNTFVWLVVQSKVHTRISFYGTWSSFVAKDGYPWYYVNSKRKVEHMGFPSPCRSALGYGGASIPLVPFADLHRPSPTSTTLPPPTGLPLRRHLDTFDPG
jgi:hypothetical protein